MKDKILVNAVKDHAFECDTNIIGRAGEGGTAQFEITLSKKMSDRTVYLDFEKPNGETYRTDPLTVTSNVAVYDVPVYLLNESGEIKVQLVLIDADGGVWKSEVKRFANLESINATTSIPIPVFPVGTANVTANGTYDITHYARVKVNVKLEDLDPELTSIEAKLADLDAILNELSGVGYTVTLPLGYYDDGEPTPFVQYSIDGGSSWHNITEYTRTVNNVTQIMFRQIETVDTYDMYYYIDGDEDERSWRYGTNYTITANTEFTFGWDEWW